VIWRPRFKPIQPKPCVMFPTYRVSLRVDRWPQFNTHSGSVAASLETPDG